MPALHEEFAMPQALVVEEATATDRYAKFVAEPLESGFGHTLGNALRRVLLTSMEGVSVSSVRIDGVAHEYSSIPHVLEDVVEIILNIKKLHFQCVGDLPRTLELTADKAGPVTAGNIREDGVTTVVNPDQIICTLDKDVPIRMELEIDRGRGFRPAEENKREDHPIGVIPVACLFSPIERVRYDILSCRVGQRTDYDRLELEVWTDGRIDPQHAVQQSSLLLREHLAIFIGNDICEPQQIKITNSEDKEVLDKLLTNVNDLEFSVRAKNCLNNANITVMGQLVEKSESEMLKYRNFGKKSLQEIREKLVEMGLSLSMTLKDEVRTALHQRLEADGLM